MRNSTKSLKHANTTAQGVTVSFLPAVTLHQQMNKYSIAYTVLSDKFILVEQVPGCPPGPVHFIEAPV